PAVRELDRDHRARPALALEPVQVAPETGQLRGVEDLDGVAGPVGAVPEGGIPLLPAALGMHPAIQPLAGNVCEQPVVDLAGPQCAVRRQQVLRLHRGLMHTRITSPWTLPGGRPGPSPSAPAAPGGPPPRPGRGWPSAGCGPPCPGGCWP